MNTLSRFIPKDMRALVLREYDGARGGLRLERVPVRAPGAGEVLVRMAAAPINPSDLLFIEGRYGFKKPLPVIPGFEGSGTVVAAGHGLLAKSLLGKRVAVGVQQGDGTWAEYLCLSAKLCIPLPRAISNEAGAMALVNPFSAWFLTEIAKGNKQRLFIQTAAGSALGRMIWRLAKGKGLDSVNIVRRSEQAEELKKLGMRHVLATDAPSFSHDLEALCREHDVRLAFDAVSGEMPGRLLSIMPRGAHVIVYGALENNASAVDPGLLIFQQKKLSGFWLADYLKPLSPVKMILLWTKMRQLLSKELKTDVRARFAIDRGLEAIGSYRGHMSGGKVLITMPTD